MLLIITLGIAIILIIIFAIFRPDKDYTDFKQYEEAKKVFMLNIEYSISRRHYPKMQQIYIFIKTTIPGLVVKGYY